MARWVSYAWAQAIAWVDSGRGLRRCTVGQHNSAYVMGASFLDALASPETIAPRGASGLSYPKQVYHGPLADFAGKDVPVVGSLRAPATWNDPGFDPVGDADKDRIRLYRALWEALRIGTWAQYTPQAPSGAGRGVFGDAYPAGVVGVEGIAAEGVLPAEDPAAMIDEPVDSSELAALLQASLLVVDALTRASIGGQTLAGVSGSALTAQYTTAVKDYDAMWRKDQQRKLKIAGGIGLAVLGTAAVVRMATKPAKGKDLAVLESGRR